MEKRIIGEEPYFILMIDLFFEYLDVKKIRTKQDADKLLSDLRYIIIEKKEENIQEYMQGHFDEFAYENVEFFSISSEDYIKRVKHYINNIKVKNDLK